MKSAKVILPLPKTVGVLSLSKDLIKAYAGDQIPYGI